MITGKFDTEIPCPYTTYKDVENRLHGTVCRYKNKPYYVSVSEECVVLHTVDRKRKVHVLDYSNLSEIDVSSIEVGYINYVSGQGIPEAEKPNKVYYMKRTVKRQWKQGLSQGNVIYEDLSGNKVPTDLLFSKFFEDSVNGVFPSFNEAIKTIGRDGEMAISQEVALKSLPVGVILLYLRGKNLGWIAPNSRSINLEDSSLAWVAKRQLSSYGLEIQ